MDYLSVKETAPQAAVLRHVKGLKNTRGIFRGTELEVLMCLKLAPFGCGFL